MGLGSAIKSVLWPSGIPVYIEDDGTVLGYVVGKEGDNEHRVYKIKSDTGTIEILADSVIVTKKALIYRPPWAKEIEDFIKKLEDEKNVNPDVELALSGSFVKDERINEILEKGKDYKRLIQQRYAGFKEMREKNLREMQYIMQKRMANAIDKGEYVKSMNDLRKKIKILELNIKEAEKLIAKLDYPAFTPPKIEAVKPVAVPVAAPSANTERIREQTLIEKKRVKKLRVLKVEADLIAMESRTKNKSVVSPEETRMELEKIDEELKYIDEILNKSLSPEVRNYFERRKDELMKRKDDLSMTENKEEVVSVSAEEEKEEVENESEEIELPPEKEEDKEDMEDLDKLISEITAK